MHLSLRHGEVEAVEARTRPKLLMRPPASIAVVMSVLYASFTNV